jgi:hypothetical protein
MLKILIWKGSIMREFKRGFYLGQAEGQLDSLFYYERKLGVPNPIGLIEMRYFNETGVWSGGLAMANQLTLFDPEEDMARLKPEVAEKVREKLEELARESE